MAEEALWDPLTSNKTTEEDASSSLSILEIGIKAHHEEQRLEQQKAAEHSQWISCFCIVKFDTDYGPMLESSHPPTKFTEDETSNICFLSFPDSNSNLDGDTIFCFRLRRSGKGDVYEYGYVFFRQEKDDTMRRGYLQKSVVLLSKFPFVKLYKQLVGVVGPLFFQYGSALLESSFQNVTGWPPPQDGGAYELPVLGKVINYSIGTSFSLSYAMPELPCNMYTCFQPILNDLWLLWELVITGEPILVFGPSPVHCSEAVLCLVNLISPLNYCGDYRPYFTIHDSDFKETIAKKDTEEGYPSMVIGVTNPYFFKALEDWPHVLVISESKGKKSFAFGSIDSFSAADWKPGLKTKMGAVSDVDFATLKKLSPDKANVSNEILQKRFLQQTLEFMSPLETYFQSLVPSEQALSVFEAPPRLRPFREEQFLSTIQPKGNKSAMMLMNPFLRKPKLSDLYKRFIRSVNFRGWLNARKKEATERIQVIYQKTIRNADINSLIKGKQEVELVNLYLHLNKELNQSRSEHYTAKLKEHLKVLHPHLPADAISGVRNVLPDNSTSSASPLQPRWRDWEVV